MKFTVLILGILVAFFNSARVTPLRVQALMSVGEELVYEVRWAFIKLGKIRVTILPPSSPEVAYSAIAYTDSYDLPFVSFQAISTAEMDSTLFSKGASHYENKDGNGFKQIYRFDPLTRTYVTETAILKDAQSPPIRPPTFDTLRLSYDRFHDGTSILYYARAHVRDQLGIRVPTLVRGKAGYTNFYFPAERTTEEIDAVPYPIRVLKFDGLAEFEGIFGLTGDFTGWFSDDEAAIPIKAKMKVILGSITIELKEWKRAGWSPPAAQ